MARLWTLRLKLSLMPLLMGLSMEEMEKAVCLSLHLETEARGVIIGIYALHSNQQ
jgi:hypothetical protein